jgi:RNA polymerase sigma-70 factor (ECF subfamily)
LEPEVQDSQEQKWIEAARGGDTEAFRRIVMNLEQRVAATVIGMIGPGPEAEDIGQETFIRLYRALPNFRGDSSLASYVTRIAINLCKDERLKRKKHTAVFSQSDDAAAALAPDPASQRDTLEDRDLADKALLQLSEEYREVVVLRLLDGFSTRETAEILAVPEGTVTSRLARAQMKLKDILGPMLEGPP